MAGSVGSFCSVIPAFASFIGDTVISRVGTEEDDPEASSLIVDAAAAGMRLDQFLSAAMGGRLSRSRIQALIAEGAVTTGGLAALQAKRKVVAGEVFTVEMPEPESATPLAEAIDLAILYEDDEIIVIDKPAGLVVHPAAGNWTGTLVNALLYHCADSLSGIGGVRRPGIVHRLDKDTSGAMVVAKSDRAHQGLATQFSAHGKDGRLQRAYRAVAWGVPERRNAMIDASLARSNSDRMKRAVVPAARADARHAVTHYSVDRPLGEFASLITCRLETGRTHQIRVHLAHIGHPIIGDPLYGLGFRSKAKRLEEPARTIVGGFGRQALHAWLLAFEHPITGEPMRFETPLPLDMQELIEALAH